MNKLCLTKIFTSLLSFFLLTALNVSVFAEILQNVAENEKVVKFMPKEKKNAPENEEVVEFIPEKKEIVPEDREVVEFISEKICDLSNHAAVSVKNTTKTLIVHFDITDTPKVIDIVIAPKSTKHFCLQHGHVISIFTVNKAGKRVSGFANVRQLLPSAKHLSIKVVYNNRTKKVEYELALDTHNR